MHVEQKESCSDGPKVTFFPFHPIRHAVFVQALCMHQHISKDLEAGCGTIQTFQVSYFMLGLFVRKKEEEEEKTFCGVQLHDLYVIVSLPFWKECFLILFRWNQF